MRPVRVCSICSGAIVGLGNDAWPVNDDPCCDQCNAERVIPALRPWERDAKRGGSNSGAASNDRLERYRGRFFPREPRRRLALAVRFVGVVGQ